MGSETQGNGDDLIIANGVDGSTGMYLLPALKVSDVAKLARGESIDALDLEEMQAVYERRTQDTFGPREGIDPTSLAESGWAVLFAHDADPAIREALRPLLDWRRSQAAANDERFYKEFAGPDGYRPGWTHRDFISRHGTSPGVQADPKCVPYYVLIVGDPETIPYSFQFQLDVVYATGRIHFDTLDEYAQYARSVVEVESGRLPLPRKAAFFGVQNPGDAATRLSANFLVKPLAEKLAERADWSLTTLIGEEATKSRLTRLLGGDETPALLFTASHGMGFPIGDERQLPHQGALLCQDWPGPLAGAGPIPPEQYFSADDLGSDAHIAGLIAIHFACYGAGTPQEDEFAHQLGARKAVAERAFVARLPRRMLAHPNGGALAVVGHVERAWGYSFHWPRVGQQTQVFEDLHTRLLNGHPIGSALEYVNMRYAGLAAELSSVLEDIKFGRRVEDLQVANMWTANNDAKNYVILGDPAVRLHVGDSPDGQATRARIATVLRSASVSAAVSVPSGSAVHPFPVSAADGASGVEAAVPVAVSFEETGPVAASLVGAGPVAANGDADLAETRAALATEIRQFAARLGAALNRLADDEGGFVVRTYTSADLSGLDGAGGDLSGRARLRAFSRIAADGSIDLCVSESPSDGDQSLWTLHLDTIRRAQTDRAETMKTLSATATELLGRLHLE